MNIRTKCALREVKKRWQSIKSPYIGPLISKGLAQQDLKHNWAWCN